MKPQEIINFLNTIEEKFPVDRWVIDGIPIWPVIRIQLTFKLNDYNIEQGRNQNKIGLRLNLANSLYILSGLAKYVYSFVADYRHNDYPNHRADAIFLSYTTCRMFSVNEEQYDVFSETFSNLLKERNLSLFSIEYPPKNEYRTPRHSKSMFIYPQYVYSKIKSICFRKESFFFPERRSFSEFNQFLNLNGLFAGNIRIKFIYGEIFALRLMADYFKGLFSIIQPSMGFLVAFYSSLGMAFNLACREYGIPSIDIQHGIYNHAVYMRWMRIPAYGYSLLPSLFWVWGKEEEGYIKEWNNKSSYHKPLCGGNVLLNVFKDDNNDMVKNFDRQINAIMHQKLSEFNILITLQPDRTIPDIIKMAMKALPDSWFWWIRLHPGMFADYKRISEELLATDKNNWDLGNASQLPLFTLLKRMDLHVTAFSSCVVEAANFGVPSIIIDKHGIEFYAKYICRKEAFVSLTLNDLIETMMMVRNRKYIIKNIEMNNKLRINDAFEKINDILKIKKSQECERS